MTLLRATGMLLVACAALILCMMLIGHHLTGAGQLIYMARLDVIQLGGETGDLVALDLATGIAVPIVRRGVGRLFSLSPDNRQIALYRGGGIFPSIGIVNVDGSNIRYMEGEATLISWLPDSAHMLMYDLRRETIYSVNVADFNQETFAAMQSLACEFALSPDAQSIAFQILQDYGQPMNARLCVGVRVNSFNNSLSQTYLPDNQRMFPVWSPDSHQIALVNNFSLYIVPDVTQDTILEVSDARMRVPISRVSWSSDSTRLLYAADVTFDIFVVQIQPQLGDAQNLTNSAAVENYPVWLSAGHEIAFTSTRDDANGEIYVMNDDGSNVRRLTFNNDVEHNLTWLP